MKTTDEPWVLYFPDLGAVRIKGKDFKQESDFKKVSMFIDQEAAESALGMLAPVDPERRLALVNARAYPLSLAMVHYRQLQAQQALKNAGVKPVSDADRRLATVQVKDKEDDDGEQS